MCFEKLLCKVYRVQIERNSRYITEILQNICLEGSKHIVIELGTNCIIQLYIYPDPRCGQWGKGGMRRSPLKQKFSYKNCPKHRISTIFLPFSTTHFWIHKCKREEVGNDLLNYKKTHYLQPSPLPQTVIPDRPMTLMFIF